MKKITFSIALSLVTLAASAQKTVLVNGGKFGDPTENVTVSIYDVQSKTSTTIDTIHSGSVQDVLIDGNSAIVAAQDSIVRYDLTTNQRVAAVKFAGVSTKSLLLGPNNELVVSNWYGKVGFNVYLYNSTTLALIDSIDVPAGVKSMLVNSSLDLLVATQNQSTGAPNYQDTLGSIVAALISSRTVLTVPATSGYTGDVGELMEKPNGTGAYAFNSVSNTIIDVDASSFPLVNTTINMTNQDLKVASRSQYSIVGDTAFIRMNQGIGTYNLSNLTVIDSNLIDTVVTAFTYDTLNHNFYVTATDFFSYTSGKIYDRAGNYLDTFATAASPEAIKMYYDQITGLLSFSSNEKPSFSVYPNPTTDQFRISTDLNQNSRIQILNANGQLVKDVMQLSGSEAIDVSGLTKGIYFVTLQHNDQIVTERLIIQ